MSSLIVLGVLIVMAFAVAYGLYTRTGSGINPRPWDGSEGAPGAKGREEVSGDEGNQGTALASARNRGFALRPSATPIASWSEALRPNQEGRGHAAGPFHYRPPRRRAPPTARRPSPLLLPTLSPRRRLRPRSPPCGCRPNGLLVRDRVLGQPHALLGHGALLGHELLLVKHDLVLLLGDLGAVERLVDVASR